MYTVQFPKLGWEFHVQIAKAPGLLHRLQQLGPELDAAIIQLVLHHLDILLRQFVVHGRFPL